jgi:hypothetical protein
MKYLCLAYYDVPAFARMTPEELAALGPRCRPHDEALRATRKVVATASLGEEARTVRTRNGKTSIVDGPYVETKEQVGGLFIVEAKDFDEAVAIASRHPAAQMGEELGWVVEVRPIDGWLEPPSH